MMLLQIQIFPWLHYFIAALLKHTVGRGDKYQAIIKFFQNFADFFYIGL